MSAQERCPPFKTENGYMADGDKGGEQEPVTTPPKTYTVEEYASLTQKLEHKSNLLDTANGTLGKLNDAAGGTITTDWIKTHKDAEGTVEAAAQEQAIKDGKATELIETAREEGRNNVAVQERKTAMFRDALRDEKLGTHLGNLLVASEVHKDALSAAQRELIRQPGPDGVYAELVQDEATGEWKPVLRTQGAGTAWPTDGKGNDLTFEEFVGRFKKANPFYFTAALQPGAGDGPGGNQPPTGSDLAADRKAIDEGDMPTFLKHRAVIFEDESLAPAKT